MHGFTALGETNSVPPLLSNTGSTMSRDVYNVVSNSQIGFGTAINQVLFGSNSQVCTNTETIKRFGFGVNTGCRSTSIQTPGQSTKLAR